MVQPPNPWGKKLGIELNYMVSDWINHTYVTKPNKNTGHPEVWVNFPSWYHVLMWQEHDVSWGLRSFIFKTLLDCALRISSFGWPWFVSFIIKTAIVSIVLYWVLCVVLESYQTWGVVGTLNLYLVGQMCRIAWEPSSLRLESEVRAVLWGTVPFICEVCVRIVLLIYIRFLE